MKLIEIELDRKRLEVVAGLVWHPLQGTGTARTKELLEFAKSTDADLKIVRGAEAPHVGLASKKEGAKPGQISAAAVIADALEAAGNRSVLVALPLPGDAANVLYIAVRDGVILADGDCVASEEQIAQRIQEDKAFGGWDQVICPEAWGIPDATERDLLSFFGPEQVKRPGPWRLQEVRVNYLRLGILVAVVAAAAIGSIYGLQAWKRHQALQAAIAEAKRQQELEAAARASATPAAQPAPWLSIPSAPSFARACADAYARIDKTAGNWKLDGAACEGDQITVRWVKRDRSAWISHLRMVHPQAMLAGDGLSATFTTPILLTPPEGRAEQLQDAMELRMRYFDLASQYGIETQIEAPQPPAAPVVLPGQSEGAPPPPPQWAETPITVKASIDPVAVATVLDSPGLRFTKLVFAYTSDGLPLYQFTGVQYVRP